MLVRVLGPVDVVGDDGTVRQSGSALRRALLALLAMNCGQVLSSDWLMENLWAGQSPESGLRALRFHISRLRRDVGDVVPIATRPGGYRLDSSRASVDALVFEDQARQARAESDDAVAAALCMATLELWRGKPFMDAADCPTLDDEAGRLEELRLTVIEHQQVRRLAAGAGGELVAGLAQLVSEYPLREGLWASLIVAQYRAGQQADALRSYERLRTILAEELGLDPSPELQDLQMRVLHQDAGLMAGARRDDRTEATVAPSGLSTLPALITSFVEVPATVHAVRTLVGARRLVTLTGPAGVGKTRLAIEVGTRALDDFDDGVCMVELGPVIEPDGVDAAIATALALRPQAGMTPLESIIDWCRRRHLLLLVDNCEHVIDAASTTVAAIASGCPTVTILATSREPLGLDGEYVHRVAPLDGDDAVTLFRERAAAADSVFVLADAEHATVVALCQRLDGVPLAIELAAAHVRAMTPAEMLGRLDDRFRLLRGPARGRPERHQTLRAAIAWSYQLLDESERVVFERASVFAGSFDLSAAEAVCADDTIARADVVVHLHSLVDQSLVVARRQPTGTRFRMLGTLREFGQQQLLSRGSDEGPRSRHLRHYVDVATHAGRLFRRPSQLDGQRILDEEWDNIRLAHGWAISVGDLDHAEDILAAVRVYAESRIRAEVGVWAERTIAVESTERTARPETFGQAASWANWAGDSELASRRVRQGITAAPSPDHPSTALCWTAVPFFEARPTPELEPWHGDPLDHLEAASAGLDIEDDWWVLISLVERAMDFRPRAECAARHGVDVVRHHLHRLIEVAERVRAPSLLANAALYEGHELIDRTPPQELAALDAYRRAVQITRHVDDVNLGGDALRAVALATTCHSPDMAAVEACHAALVHLYDNRHWYRLWQTMDSVALVLASNGRVEEASTLLGYLEAHRATWGRETDLGFRDRARELVGRQPDAALWMERGAMTDRDAIVAHAINTLIKARASQHQVADIGDEDDSA